MTVPAAEPSRRARVGRWLFRRRSWLPLPVVVLLLVARPAPPSWVPVLVLIGAGLVALGEGVRLWAVRHIGVISRTRADRLGPLITSGPYALVRHPLYVGNVLLWSGVACWSGAVWLPPVCGLLFGVEYFFIVAWEAHLLADRYGASYAAYVDRVPAWLPVRASLEAASERHSWRDTLYSERGTLLALVVAAAIFALKHRL